AVPISPRRRRPLAREFAQRHPPAAAARAAQGPPDDARLPRTPSLRPEPPAQRRPPPPLPRLNEIPNPLPDMITTRNHGLTRRAFLRGLGATIALPTLESLTPAARAAVVKVRAGAATTATGMPLRMGFVAFANGSNYERWLPKGVGRDYELNE